MRNLNLKIVVILWALIMASCYEPIKGCLDTFSSNYDVSADESCDDCCKYPELILRFDHKWGEESLNANDVVSDDFGNDFGLTQFEFFISDIVLHTMTGETVVIEDSVLLSLDGIEGYYKKDFTHVDLGKTTYTIGEIKTDKEMIGFQFFLGLDPIFNQLEFEQLANGFVLKVFEDSLYVDNQFVLAEIEIKRDTSIDLTTMIGIMDDRLYEKLEFDLSFFAEKGEDVDFIIIVDYKKWFEGIDVRMDNILLFEEALINNFSNAFSIE